MSGVISPPPISRNNTIQVLKQAVPVPSISRKGIKSENTPDHGISITSLLIYI